MHPANDTQTNPTRTHRAALALIALSAAVALGIAMLATGAGAAPPVAGDEVRDMEFEIAYPAEDGWKLVQLHLLVLYEADRDADEVSDGARAAALERFPGGTIIEPGVVGQYVALGWTWPNGRAAWEYNPTNAPGHLDNLHGIFQASADAWSDGGAHFRFSGGETSSATAGLCSRAEGGDGRNTVAWGDLGNSTLAMTCFDNLSDAHEFDMIFDIGRNWTAGGGEVVIDLQSVATHEFGHALGLNHSRDSAAVMYTPYRRGELKRELSPDDRAGLVSLYGSQASQQPPTETPTATPDTATATPTPGSTTTTPTATPSATPGDPSPGAELHRRGVVPGLVRN